MPLGTPDKPRSPFASVPNGSSPCGLAAILKKASTPPKRAASTPPKRAATPPRRATTPDATTPAPSRKTPKSSRGTQTPPRSADAAAGASTPPRSRRRTPRSSRSAEGDARPPAARPASTLRHVDLEADDAFACLLHDAVTSARKKAASAKSARVQRGARARSEDADVDAWPEMPLPASPTRAPDDDDAPAPTRAPDDDDAPAPARAPDDDDAPAAPEPEPAPAEAAAPSSRASPARARLSAAMVRLLNAASQDELKDVLAGIGVVRARRVVEARAERPFDDLDEALARLGLSKRQAENIVLANLQQILCFPA
ncbi:hypothetical protein SO694_00022147 [Aureococcus anophagefferens]|uniref:Uncharacterized protein n=1 Tax=Aureococcus anophagefferens TaxID=44056 RepID=A0ABR1FTG4_AURAN